MNILKKSLNIYILSEKIVLYMNYITINSLYLKEGKRLEEGEESTHVQTILILGKGENIFGIKIKLIVILVCKYIQ